MASGELWRPSQEGRSSRSGSGIIDASQQRFLNAVASEIPHTEFNGFWGVMAEEIGEWQKREWGRAFGFFSPVNTGGHIFSYIEPDAFRGVMYALPLTESTVQGADQQALLVAPDSNHGRYVVITPSVVLDGNPENARKINRRFVESFNRVFSPNKTPGIFSHWRDVSGDPFDHFLQHPDGMGVEIVEILRGDDREVALQQALDVAMKEEVRRGVNGEPITLIEQYPEDWRFFEELSAEMRTTVGPIERALRDINPQNL